MSGSITTRLTCALLAAQCCAPKRRRSLFCRGRHCVSPAAEQGQGGAMPGQGAAAAAYVCGTFDTKAAELHYLADLLRGGRCAHGDGRPGHARSRSSGTDVTADRGRRCASGGRPGRARARRPWCGRECHDGGVRALARGPRRYRRDHRRRRLGQHRPGRPGDARAAGRRAQGAGLDRGVGQRGALCRPGRHHDAARGHRRAGPQPDLAPGAGQRRACAGRA